MLLSCCFAAESYTLWLTLSEHFDLATGDSFVLRLELKRLESYPNRIQPEWLAQHFVMFHIYLVSLAGGGSVAMPDCNYELFFFLFSPHILSEHTFYMRCNKALEIPPLRREMNGPSKRD